MNSNDMDKSALLTLKARFCGEPKYESGCLLLDESFLSIPGEMETLHLPADYLAEVLFLFDCNLNKRVLNSPILLRFENFDLFIRLRSHKDFEVWIGCLDDQAIPAESPTIEGSRCLIWARDSSVIPFLGSKVHGIALKNMHGHEHLLLSMEDEKEWACGLP